jgi:hypothetical protein
LRGLNTFGTHLELEISKLGDELIIVKGDVEKNPSIAIKILD